MHILIQRAREYRKMIKSLKIEVYHANLISQFCARSQKQTSRNKQHDQMTYIERLKLAFFATREFFYQTASMPSMHIFLSRSCIQSNISSNILHAQKRTYNI